MSKPITVDSKVYEAKLDDSYALGKIFSHLVHKVGLDDRTAEGTTPDEIVINYIESLRERTKKFAEWLVGQRFIDGVEYMRHYDLLFIDEGELPQWLVEGFERDESIKKND